MELKKRTTSVHKTLFGSPSKTIASTAVGALLISLGIPEGASTWLISVLSAFMGL